jgi:hypothetical protein
MHIITVLVLFLVLSQFALQHKCHIKECHGVHISCTKSPEIPCDKRYEFGDFCRHFLNRNPCINSNQDCTMDKDSVDSKFWGCAACITRCEEKSVGDKYMCENQCRNEFPITTKL